MFSALVQGRAHLVPQIRAVSRGGWLGAAKHVNQSGEMGWSSAVRSTIIRGPVGGIFAQCRHSANYDGVCPGNTPENHSPTEACMINSKL